MDSKTIKNLQDRTDAKLRYAEIHLKELKDREPLGGDDFDRAHQESFLFHLLGTLDAFLHELTEYYHLNHKGNKVSFTQFDKLKKKGVSIPEFDRIWMLQRESNSWLSHARDMRNYSAHNSNISRTIHVGGIYDNQVWLKSPKKGKNIERHFVEEFYSWLENMRNLIEDLRNSAIKSNP